MADQTGSSIQDIMSRKKMREDTVDIFLDPEEAERAWGLAKTIAGLELQMQQPKRGKGLAAPSAEKEMERLQRELEELTEAADVVTFKFRGIGRKRWDELVRSNPATDQEKQEWKAENNPGLPLGDAFVAALLSETCVDPVMSREEAQKLTEEWPPADVETLFATAMAVCRERVNIPFSKSKSEKTTDSD